MENICNLLKKRSTKTLFGSMMISFSSSILMTWGTSSLYFLSYLHKQNQNISKSTNSIIIIATIIPMILVSPLANPIILRIGVQKMIKLFAIIFFVSPNIVWFKLSLTTLMIFLAIIPGICIVFTGIGNYICLWSQFPKYINRMTSLAIVFGSLGTSIWGLIFVHAINPNDIQVTLSQNENQLSFFGEQVTNRVKIASILIYSLAGIILFLGSILVIKKQDGPSYSIQFNENKQNKPAQEIQNNQQHNQKQLEQYNTEKNNNQLQEKNAQNIIPSSSSQSMDKNQKDFQEQVQTSLKKLLGNRRSVIILLVAFLFGLYQIYLIINIKIIYTPALEDHFISYCFTSFSFASIFGTLFWGLLGDKKGISISMLILLIFGCIFKIFNLIATMNPTQGPIMASVILIALIDNGMAILAGPGFIQIFGFKEGTKLLPYKGMVLTFIFAFNALFQFITQEFLGTIGILWCFYGAGVVALVLGIYFFWYNKKYPLIKKEENYMLNKNNKFDNQKEINQ